MLARTKAELRRFRDSLELVPTTVFVVAGLMLCVHHYYGTGRFFRKVLGPWLLASQDISYLSCLYWSVTSWFTYLLIPLVAITVVSRMRRDQAPVTTGLGIGDWRMGLTCCAIFYGVMLPLLAFVAFTGDFQGKYPLCDDATRSTTHFVIYELFFALYFIAWEYFWRGFLIFGLEKKFGFWTIFVSMLPFVVAHWPKPALEAMSSILGGLALGYLAWRTRSIWYGWFIHSATAITLEVIIVAIEKE